MTDPHALLAALTPKPPFFILDAPLRPQPKDRPRFYQRAVTAERTRVYEQALRAFTHQALIARRDAEGSRRRLPELREPHFGGLAVAMFLHGAHPQCDVDNLAKAVLDALKDLVYLDDRQVKRLAVALEPGEPAVQVLIAHL